MDAARSHASPRPPHSMLRKVLPRTGLPRLRFATIDAQQKGQTPPPEAAGAKDDAKEWDPAKATNSEETVKAERSELESGSPEKGEEVRER